MFYPFSNLESEEPIEVINIWKFETAMFGVLGASVLSGEIGDCETLAANARATFLTLRSEEKLYLEPSVYEEYLESERESIFEYLFEHYEKGVSSFGLNAEELLSKFDAFPDLRKFF